MANQTVSANDITILRLPTVAKASGTLSQHRTSSGNRGFRWSLSPSNLSADISTVLLLSVTLPLPIPASVSQLLQKQPQPFSSPQQGDRITLIGSPFGATAPDHFVNSCAVGIVSQVIQSSGGVAMLLADVRATPGMEGCPVFDAAGNLVGVLSLPFCVGNHELPVIIPAAAIAEAAAAALLWQLSNSSSSGISRQPSRSNADSIALPPPAELLSLPALQQGPETGAAVRHAAGSVLGVVLDNGQWASGVLANRSGTILTNAHLFEAPARASGIEVAVHCAHGISWHPASLVYTFQGALDIAIVRLRRPPSFLQPARLRPLAPQLGSGCYAVGHGLFDPSDGMPPLVTAGNVAQVLSLPDTSRQQQPAMLLTTAAVHSGASGGALFDGRGDLLGLITSNTRHASGATIPHLNYSISGTYLEPLWLHLQQHQDVQSFRQFDLSDAQLKRMWSLQPFKPQEIPRSKL